LGINGDTGTCGADKGFDVGVPEIAAFGRLNPSSDTSNDRAGDLGGLAKESGDDRGMGIFDLEDPLVGDVTLFGECGGDPG
jgi:hypothetical protein